MDILIVSIGSLVTVFAGIVLYFQYIEMNLDK